MIARYRIIDEPTARPWAESIIVNPLIILFAAIFVPFVFDPPLLGRFWIPLVWLIVNGIALGSATLKREILTIVAGAVAFWLVIIVAAAVDGAGGLGESGIATFPYVRLALFAVLFTTLYLVVFSQSRSYQLFRAVKG